MRWLVWGTAAAAALGTMLSWHGALTGDLAFWFAAALLGELMWIRLPMGGATLSMASCCHFAALLLLPRGQAMAVVMISVAIAEAAVLRKPSIRVVFNAAQSALTVGAASLVLTAFGGGVRVLHNPRLELEAIPLLLAALTYFMVNSGAVSIAVALTEKTSPLAAWQRNFGSRYELLSSGTLVSLGVLLADHYLQTGPGGAFLIICPVVLAHQGYRMHLLQQQKASTDSDSSASREVTQLDPSATHDNPSWPRSA